MGFKAHIDVGYPIDDVWRWFSRPRAVDRLTPGFAPLKPVTRADSLRSGTTVFSLPAKLTWVAQHEKSGFVPQQRFVDKVVNRPFSLVTPWRHTHTFESRGPKQTRVSDRVTTPVPGFLLDRIFAYRYAQLKDDLSFLKTLRAIAQAQDSPDDFSRITVGVTGSTGLVGSALVAQLSTAGFNVIRFVRSTRSTAVNPDERTWSPDRPCPSMLDGIDCLVHLAGAPVFGRFNAQHREQVYSSRVAPTTRLARLVADSPTCRTMVCANAIGYYGAITDHFTTESAPAGTDFLATTCRDWQAATDAVAAAGKRVVIVRTGLVVSSRGGLLVPLSRIIKTGLGGKLASGRQFMSWISLDDLTSIYCRAIIDKTMSGPINATAPKPVTNAHFTRALGGVLNRPTIVPVPAIAPEIMLGEPGAKLTALAAQHVVPARLTELGYEFRYPTLVPALRHELGKVSLSRVLKDKDR